MKVTFLGTRGYIKIRSDRHRLHTALLLEHDGVRVMVDAGEDWLGKLDDVSPDYLVLTHAHPDHAWGLKHGAPCPVYATRETWEIIKAYPISKRHTITPRRRVRVGSLHVRAHAVAHSTRAPAVALHVSNGRSALCYAPDVVFIEDRGDALSGTDLYVGDGATIQRSMVRRSGDALIGHAPVRTQLTWCQKEGVPRALFTHCGTEIVSAEETQVAAQIASLGKERGVRAGIAYDGMSFVLSPR